MKYLIWINDFIVKENEDEYDFLYEMYPEIKELYNKIWFIRNYSKIPLTNKQINTIYRLENQIKMKLEILGMPEYILLISENEKLIEPISGIELNITKKSLNLRDIEEEVERRYIDQLNIKTVNFLNDKLFEFKKEIKNKKEYVK